MIALLQNPRNMQFCVQNSKQKMQPLHHAPQVNICIDSHENLSSSIHSNVGATMIIMSIHYPQIIMHLNSQEHHFWRIMTPCWCHHFTCPRLTLFASCGAPWNANKIYGWHPTASILWHSHEILSFSSFSAHLNQYWHQHSPQHLRNSEMRLRPLYVVSLRYV